MGCQAANVLKPIVKQETTGILNSTVTRTSHKLSSSCEGKWKQRLQPPRIDVAVLSGKAFHCNSKVSGPGSLQLSGKLLFSITFAISLGILEGTSGYTLPRAQGCWNQLYECHGWSTSYHIKAIYKYPQNINYVFFGGKKTKAIRKTILIKDHDFDIPS